MHDRLCDQHSLGGALHTYHHPNRPVWFPSYRHHTPLHHPVYAHVGYVFICLLLFCSPVRHHPAHESRRVSANHRSRVNRLVLRPHLQGRVQGEDIHSNVKGTQRGEQKSSKILRTCVWYDLVFFSHPFARVLCGSSLEEPMLQAVIQQ